MSDLRNCDFPLTVTVARGGPVVDVHPRAEAREPVRDVSGVGGRVVSEN